MQYCGRNTQPWPTVCCLRLLLLLGLGLLGWRLLLLQLPLSLRQLGGVCAILPQLVFPVDVQLERLVKNVQQELLLQDSKR
jgi:hypothetical protein